MSPLPCLALLSWQADHSFVFDFPWQADHYFLFDFPGQVELFTLHSSCKAILDALAEQHHYRVSTGEECSTTG